MQTIDMTHVAGLSCPHCIKAFEPDGPARAQDYRVSWEIDIVAITPEEAAAKAWEILRGPDSTACVFTAINEAGESSTIDLLELAEAGNAR